MIPGLGTAPGEEKVYPLQYSVLENSMDCSPWGRKESDMTEQPSGITRAQLVKNLPAMQETPVCFLGWEDLLEKEQTIYSIILGLPWWLSW